MEGYLDYTFNPDRNDGSLVTATIGRLRLLCQDVQTEMPNFPLLNFNLTEMVYN